MPKEQIITGAALDKRLASLDGWSASNGTISRSFVTDGWPTTMMLVNMIGFFAEAADHHPDLTVSWGRVEVRLSTHSAGGITEKDLELARLINQQALWRPEGAALSGTSKHWVSSEAP